MKFFKKKTITRMTEHGLEAYLIRWNLFQCPWFSIKIHRILVSDDDCMHDHPWTFISFILKGGYVEVTPDWTEHYRELGLPPGEYRYSKYDSIVHVPVKKRLYGAGSILYRPARYIHRLEIFQPATTLVINFRKTKGWGFFTKMGFIPHYNYSKQVHCE